MNRRDFMKTTVMASATAALARPGEAATVAPSDRLAVGVHWLRRPRARASCRAVVDDAGRRGGRRVRRLHGPGRTGARPHRWPRDDRPGLPRDPGEPGVDAVFIVTPDHWHKTMAVEALAAKKDVYLEKPMSYSIEDGLGIVDAVKRSRTASCRSGARA